MRKLLALWIVALCAIVGAFQSQAWVAQVPAAVGGFVGVTDEDPNVVHFYGLVAAGSAHTTHTAADLCDSAVSCVTAANVCTGVKSLANGQLDISSGLYCNSASQTVSTWASTNCTFASGTCRIMTLYDQVGSANATAVSYTVAPYFILSGVSSKPTGACVAANSTLLTATITSVASPFSLGITFERNATFTTFQEYIGAAPGTIAFGGYGAANSMWAQGSALASFQITGVTDGSGTSDFSKFHRTLLTIPTTTGTADVYVDGGAPTTSATTGNNATGTAFGICGTSGDFSNAFITSAWVDNAQTASGAAEAVTNLTTVPLP